MPGKSSKSKERNDPFKDEQPPGYHYNRQERLSMPTAPRHPERRGGIFRRNRTLLIILVDLVIVLILGLFLMRFLYAQVSRADLEGYSVVLRGAYSQDVVIATLTVKNNHSESRREQRVNVRFSLVRNPGEEDSTYVSSLAPPGREEESILRATIATSRRSKVLYAEVRIGDSVKRLSTGLEP